MDGDRERLAYEADAYLTQLSYYAGDADPRMPRATFDRLMEFPTWKQRGVGLHIVKVFIRVRRLDADRGHGMAFAGPLATEWLKTKLLDERVGPDGLITSTPEQIKRGDIVDWPAQERDQYVFTGVNTVVNAFHLRARAEMSELAEALGKNEEAAKFAQRERSAHAAFQEKLFVPVRGLYRDGVGTDHASEHANLFPLAFGLAPLHSRPRLAQWLAGRGMAGSVYAAQYLLEDLFENGEDTAALALIGAEGDRSWRHMVESGTTITWEAWDQKYKPNQDWNHAWGAAPANLLPRFVLGVRVLTPGWTKALIQPHPGTLVSAEGRCTHTARRYLGCLENGKEFCHDSRSAVRRNGKGRATRVPGFAQSLDRRRECAGASRRAMVEIGKRCLGNTQYRGAMTEVERIRRCELAPVALRQLEYAVL